MQIVEGGGLRFMTDDPMLIVAVQRCAQLEKQLIEARHTSTARYRTLRHDVREIKQSVRKIAAATIK